MESTIVSENWPRNEENKINSLSKLKKIELKKVLFQPSCFHYHIKKLTLGRQAFMQHSFACTFNQKNYRKFKPIWHCCMYMFYNAAHGKVGFENNWLI
jgi:hypothetical protein